MRDYLSTFTIEKDVLDPDGVFDIDDTVEVKAYFTMAQRYPITPVTIQPPDPTIVDIKEVWVTLRDKKKMDIYMLLSTDRLEEIATYLAEKEDP